MALADETIGALHSLREGLGRAGYCEFVAYYGWETPRDRARTFDCHFAPPLLGSLAGFCERGTAIAIPNLGITPSEVAALAADGIVVVDADTVRLAGLRIVPHFGLVILCDIRSAGATAYHGEDSLALGRHLLNTHCESLVLDLCGGVGTQGLLAASRGANVISVDVNPELRDLQRANVALNRCSGSIEYLCGNLFEPVLGRQFDAIYANPPLVPVPTGRTIGLPSDGGPSGLEVSKSIAAGAAAHLASNGSLFMQGLTFGDECAPNLNGIIDVLEAEGFGGHLTTLYREEAGANGIMMKALACTAEGPENLTSEVATEEYKKLAEQEGGYLFSWQLHASRASMPRRIEFFPVHLRNDKLWQC